MSQKIALKRLTASDLTFFKWHMDNHPAGKQKAINLNANIFIKSLYPSLPSIIEEKHGTVSIDIWIYGPGMHDGYNLQRKIQKKGSYKNYRLDGEFITDPPEHPERFHSLQPDDFVIFDFAGDIEPNSAKLVFIAKAIKSDTVFHSALTAFIEKKSMISLKPASLEKLIAKAELPGNHPANLLLMDTKLEDAALGGIEGVKALRSGPFKGKVGRKALEQARKNAQKTGREGEEYVCLYLEKLKESKQIEDFIWVSDENAIAPYDFQINRTDKSVTFIDVKSTKGDFNNRIHISFNELLKMREKERYDIYRIFNMEENRTYLRISENLNEFAAKIVKTLEQLPNGIQSDGISLSPNNLFFGESIEIKAK